MKPKLVVRRTTFLIICLSSFLIGLVLAHWYLVSDAWIAPGLAIIFLTVFAWRKKQRNLLACGVIILSFGLGWWRGSAYAVRVAQYNQFFGRQVSLKVTALEDGVYSDKHQLTFAAGSIEVTSPGRTKLPGQINVEGLGQSAVYRGDELLVSGKLFPRRGSNQAGISFASVTLVARHPSWIDTLRRKFIVGLQNVLPESLASFGLGLLIGQRSTLSQNVLDMLTAVGLIHIVAVSGYNLTVITQNMQKLLAKRSRYQTVVGSLVLIGVFLMLTGQSASIVRAAVVSVISLITWYYGRTVRPVLILLLSAAITAGINPLYIWSNVGWYLSFTAFFGVLVLAPEIQKALPKKASKFVLTGILLETISAQLCTLPVILLVFGRLSVVSIAANILVVPVVPFAMLFTLIAGVSGMLGALTGIFALPAKLLLRYMVDVSSLFARVPHANVQVGINFWQMIVLYLLVILLTTILYYKNRGKLVKIEHVK